MPEKDVWKIPASSYRYGQKTWPSGPWRESFYCMFPHAGKFRPKISVSNCRYTVLRPRIICLKKVHPAKRARAQELYIVSSYTYAFDETLTCVWIFLWYVSLERQEAHLYDGFTQTIPTRLLPDIQIIEMFFKPASHWPASRALIGRYRP
jgi:hypothetical protein